MPNDGRWMDALGAVFVYGDIGGMKLWTILLFSACVTLAACTSPDPNQRMIRDDFTGKEYEQRTDSGLYHIHDSLFSMHLNNIEYGREKRSKWVNQRAGVRESVWLCRDNPNTHGDYRHQDWDNDCFLKEAETERKYWMSQGWNIVQYDTAQAPGQDDLYFKVQLRKARLLAESEHPQLWEKEQ